MINIYKHKKKRGLDASLTQLKLIKNKKNQKLKNKTLSSSKKAKLTRMLKASGVKIENRKQKNGYKSGGYVHWTMKKWLITKNYINYKNHTNHINHDKLLNNNGTNKRYSILFVVIVDINDHSYWYWHIADILFSFRYK